MWREPGPVMENAGDGLFPTFPNRDRNEETQWSWRSEMTKDADAPGRQ